MKCIFGPVPSRRLGYSLGVDIIPPKTCTLDCVYCQLGRTTNRTLERKEWISSDTVMAELKEMLRGKIRIDYITFSGSGEPTLNSALGKIVREIKILCDIPVAVLTNGTLLNLPEVRSDLMQADLVVPSLDAASTGVFKDINRPDPALQIDSIIEGLNVFSQDFTGTLWVEVMIVRGVNDAIADLDMIRDALKGIRAHKIQINTVTRPPADIGAQRASHQTLDLARSLFGKTSEIIGGFQKEKLEAEEADVQERILNLLSRHPDSLTQVSISLGVSEHAAAHQLSYLLEKKKVVEIQHEGESFYRVT